MNTGVTMAMAAWLVAIGSAAGQLASFYGEAHRGRLMANCRPFNPDRMTCASWFYPLGTMLEVGVVRDGAVERWIRVKVTDRGPHRRYVRAGRVIDLSAAAFRRIADPREGLVKVVVRRAGA